jgi:hypothetical protein
MKEGTDKKVFTYVERAKMPSLTMILMKLRHLLPLFHNRVPFMEKKDEEIFLFERMVLKHIRKTLGVSLENEKTFGNIDNNDIISRGLEIKFRGRAWNDTENKRIWIENTETAAQNFILDVDIPTLLRTEITLECIARYFTDSLNGLLRLGFNMDDLANIQYLRKGKDIDILVDLFGFSFSSVRSIHKTFFLIETLVDRKAPFSERSRLKCRIHCDVMNKIGLFTHELCIIGMKKMDIHRFGFSQIDWFEKLNFGEIHVQLLRIKLESDFTPPTGSLYKAFWNIDVMMKYLNITGVSNLPPIPSSSETKTHIVWPTPSISPSSSSSPPPQTDKDALIADEKKKPNDGYISTAKPPKKYSKNGKTMHVPTWRRQYRSKYHRYSNNNNNNGKRQ